jgi:prepilin peptidase CpaA
MNTVMSSLEITTVCFALVAVAWDISTRRIPNVLTFGAALVALGAHGYLGGWNGLGMAAAGWAAGVALFFPVFALGGMGAGDVKLLGAVGAWLGPAAAVWIALYSGIAGGLMGLIVASYCGYLIQALTNVRSLLLYWRIVGLKPAPELTLSTHDGPRLAYALPIFAGLMVTIWFQ